MYHDIGTNDFLTGLMERHEKMTWMLRTFLAGCCAPSLKESKRGTGEWSIKPQV
jgi:hypothetical protein